MASTTAPPQRGPADQSAGPGGRSRRIGAALVHVGSRPDAGPLVATLLVFAGFSLTAHHFLEAAGLANTLLEAADLGLVAIPATLLLISGEFDLSVGSVLGFGAAIGPYLIRHSGLSPALAVVVALLMGASIGLLNGLTVRFTRIPSLIVTLGAMLFWRGVLQVITHGFLIELPEDAGVLGFLGSSIGHGYNITAIWFVISACFFTWLLTSTGFGNWIFASGGNERSARAMGVPVDRLRTLLFVVSSTAAVFAGLAQSARFGSVDATRGTGLELQVVAAIVIGGTRITGGYGSVIGTALGCLTVAMIDNGMALLGLAGYWYQAVIGILIVAAVVVNEGVGRITRLKLGSRR